MGYKSTRFSALLFCVIKYRHIKVYKTTPMLLYSCLFCPSFFNEKRQTLEMQSTPLHLISSQLKTATSFPPHEIQPNLTLTH